MQKCDKNSCLEEKGPKRIVDYPMLHGLLTGLFQLTYQGTLEGRSPKDGFTGGDLVASPLHGTPLGSDYWKAKIGSYRIMTSFVSECGVTIEVRPPETREDIFLPDIFTLLTLQGTFSVWVSDSGALDCIEMIFEDGMPEFSLDLIRDFPGRNAKSDTVLKHILTRNRNSSKAFSPEIAFSRVTIIEV